MPISLTETGNAGAPARWAEAARQGGYLTPAQRKAFERAIGLVTNNLHQVLSQSVAQRSGRFEFDAFVDSLEQDFLQQPGGQTAEGLPSDVAQTTFWAIRLMADHLITACRPRQSA